MAEKLDLSTMSSEDQEVLRAGAKSILAHLKAGVKTEPEIPEDVKAFLEANGMTIEAKKPAVMSAVDTSQAAPDPKDLQLNGIGPQATPVKAPAIIHEGTKREMKDFSIAHAIGILAMGGDYPNLAEAGLEIEVLKEQKAAGREPRSAEMKEVLKERRQQLKDLNIGSEVAGNFLIPTEVNDEIIRKLRGQEIWMQMGVDYLPNSPKYQTWDKEGRDPLVYWPGDTPTSDLTASDLDYGEVTLTLHQMACVVPIRLNLIKYARINVEEEVRRRIVQSMAIEQTKVGLRGTGSKQPLGLFLLPEMVEYTTASVGIPSFNDLLDAQSAIRARDGIVDASQSAWVMSESYLNLLKKSKTGTAEYNYIIDLTDMPPTRILGLPVYTSSKIRTDLGVGADESRLMLVGNTKSIMLADGGQTEISVLKELYALQFKIGVLASKDIDFGLRNPAELQFLTGLTLS